MQVDSWPSESPVCQTRPFRGTPGRGALVAVCPQRAWWGVGTARSRQSPQREVGTAIGSTASSESVAGSGHCQGLDSLLREHGGQWALPGSQQSPQREVGTAMGSTVSSEGFAGSGHCQVSTVSSEGLTGSGHCQVSTVSCPRGEEVRSHARKSGIGPAVICKLL